MNPIWPVIAARAIAAAFFAPALARALRWPRFSLAVPVAALVSVSCLFTFVGEWTWGMPIVGRLRTRRKCVALTFDDGPSPDATPRILDALRAAGATATFFVLGEAVRRHPELLRRIVREGHAVGLHGYCHRSLVFASPAAFVREISRARAACPGVILHWFRPPHGFKTLAMPFLTRRLGLRLAAWSVNPRDYQADSPSQIASAVLSRLHPGAIVLLHDGPGRTATADALPHILAGLREQGYRCVGLE